MSDPRWQAIRDLFLDALDQPEAGRELFLAARCGDDAAMLDTVRRLLAAHEQPDHRLSRAIDLQLDDSGTDEGDANDDETDALLGQHVGPYRVLRQIGEGGMGAVYEAEQIEPVRRHVALKVVKRGMDTREVVRRFGLERQALALMNHSCIAKVFDAGMTDDGRPYFVMELAEGVPLTEYCDRERLSLRARLQLIVTLCDAIQHAHHKGVVHRDLKPSNVLVVSEGGKPTPKVIDFGIAKAIGSNLDEQSLHTAVGTLIGTPAYMSPEQAALGLSDIDSRTDVYSLAALLYELAVGNPPFPADTLRGSDFLRALQVIREDDALRPSQRFAAMEPEARAEQARLRSSQPRDIARELAEIDWIVMRGLAKERAERYQTAAALAADIGCYLAGLPLDAGPPSRAYRLRKFVARHRFGVAAGAAIAALLVTFAVSMTIQSLRLERALQVADAERRTSQNVSDFLVDMLRVTDPKEGNRADMSIREMLDNAAGKIESDFADQPHTRAKILTTIGTVYREIGVYDTATNHLAAAVAVMREAQPQDAAELGRALNALGELAHDEGNLDVAERHYTEALPLLRAHPHRLTDASVVLTNLTVLAIDRDDAITAEKLGREALAIRQETLGPRHRDTAQSMRKLARALQKQGRWREAEPLIREAIDIESADPSVLNVFRASALADLNMLLRLKGDYRGAEAICREVLEIYRSSLGDKHQYTAIALYNHGRSLTALARYDEAQARLEEALAIYDTLFGGEHQNAARVMSGLADIEMMRGHYASAEQRLRKVLALAHRVFGPRHRETAANMNLLGNTLREMGRLDEALALQREALSIRVASLGADHVDHSPYYRALALTYIARGELSSAEDALREAKRIEVEADVGDMLPAALTRGVHAWLLHLQGKHDLALQEMSAAVGVQREWLGDLHPEVGRTLAWLGEIECATGNAVAGQQHLADGIKAFRVATQASDPRVQRAEATLRQCMLVATR